MEFKDALPILKKLHKERRLIVFAGSGVSRSSGLPSWKEFVEQIISFCERIQGHLHKRAAPTDVLEAFGEAIKISRSEVAKHPVWITSILKDQLAQLQRRSLINALEMFNSQVMLQFISKRPSQNHFDILKCNFPYIVTSNYDNLLQLAAIELGMTEWEFSAYDFTEPERIASAIYLGEPAMIHVHGMAQHATSRGGFEDLILSKNDYQRIKKDRPAMAQIIRTLFLKYDVLFVGFGADDPHINDIMEEITYFFPDKSSDVRLPTYHVIWKREADTSAVQEHYAKLNRTNFVYIRDYSELSALFGELQT